jgi:hypothetical protein
MHDIRKPNHRKKRSYSIFLKKIKIKHIIILAIILILLIFPEQIGTFIGNWISDLFGTIIDIINNG